MGQDIAGQGGRVGDDGAIVLAQLGDLAGIDGVLAGGGDDGVALEDPDSGVFGGFDQRALRVVAQVDHRHVTRTGRLCIQRRLVGRVVVGEDHDLAARQNGEPVDIGAQRRCQHDAGTVIVRENQRAFDRALRQNDPLGADLPEPLTGRAVVVLRAQMVGHPLQRSQVVVVVVTGNRGAAQDRHVFQGFQFG